MALMIKKRNHLKLHRRPREKVLPMVEMGGMIDLQKCLRLQKSLRLCL